MIWILPLGILIVFEIIADIFAKTWSIRGGGIYATIALAAYLLGNTFWLFALKNGAGLSKGSIIFSIVSAVLAVIIGVFFYGEVLTKLQFVGILLGLVSLVLIFW